MSGERNHKERYVRGNLPNLVGVIARNPLDKPADWRTLERRKYDEKLEYSASLVAEGKANDLRSEWEHKTNKIIEKNTIRRKVNDMMLQNQFSLEDRRERLRQLLEDEQNQMIKEMELSHETPLELRARMRERANELRRKREQERLEFVKQKEDQRWRDNCEELRTILSKRSCMTINSEREKQLQVKQLQEKQRLEDEAFFTDLWQKDIQSKMQREEREAAAKHAKSKDTISTLQEQMAACQAAKENRKIQIQEEAQLLEEAQRLRELEDQQAANEKKRKQAMTRNQYSKSIKLRLKKQAQDEQDELALDMKILESLIEESKNEALESHIKKERLRKEIQNYRDYLNELKQNEAEEEKRLEKMLAEELEAMWKRRLVQWQKERDARKKLMQDVIEGRKVQIKEKIDAIQKEREESKSEIVNTVNAIKAQRELEMEERRKSFQKAKEYQMQLLGQMDHKRRLKVIADDTEYSENIRQYEAEANYQAKLREALDKPPSRVHPLWQIYSGAKASQPVGT